VELATRAAAPPPPAALHPRRRWGLGAYVAAVTAAAAGVVGGEVLMAAAPPPAENLRLVAVVAVLVGWAELRPLRSGPRATSHVVLSTALVAAVLVLAPGPVVLAVAAAGSLVGDLAGRRAPVKAVFNAATAVLSAGAGTWVLRAAGTPLLEEGVHLEPRAVGGMVAAGAAMSAVNLLLTGTVVALATGTQVWRTIRRDVLVTVQADAASLPLGPVMAAVGLEQPALLPLAVAMFAVVFALAGAAVALRDDAATDPLTGLLNRRQLDVESDLLLAGAAAGGRPVAVLVLDLDGFKPINDAHGHHVGDQVIREVAQRLRRTVGEGAAVARHGGDEFVVVAPVDEEAGAAVLARRLREAVAAPLRIGSLRLDVTASVGLAVHPVDGGTTAALVRAADRAMYEAKARRGGRRAGDVLLELPPDDVGLPVGPPVEAAAQPAG
jgi:diguanylate cyclase